MKYLYLLIFLIPIALIFIQGSLSVPTTTDSHVYRLSRMLYWNQNHSLIQKEPLTSHEYMPIFPELIALLIFVITNNVHFLFLTQYLSYLILILVIYRMNQDKDYAFPLTILIASIPIIVLQASSTQTDVLLTALLVTGYFYISQNNQRLYHTILGAILFGLALSTKTNAIFLLPIFLTFFTQQKIIKKGVLFVLISLLTFLPFLFRQIYMYNRIQHNPTYSVFVQPDYLINAVVPNLFRNIVMHFPMLTASSVITKYSYSFFKLIRLPLDEPRTTWPDTPFSFSSYPIPHEDLAPAPLHVLLILFYLIFTKKKSTNVVVLALCFLLFSTVMRWQPYHIRLQIPFLVFGTIFVVPKIWIVHKLFIKWIAGFSFISGIIVIIFNITRPVVLLSDIPILQTFQTDFQQVSIFSRADTAQLFISRPYWERPYSDAVHFLSQSNIKNVKLNFYDEYYFPFMHLLYSADPSITFLTKYDPNSDATVITSKSPIDQTGECFESNKDTFICVELHN